MNTKKECQLIENAISDPSWDSETNTQLCMGDCEICPHYSGSKEDKLGPIIDAIYKCIERKLDKLLNPELLGGG